MDDLEWRTPGDGNSTIELATLDDGTVFMRHIGEPGTVLRYTAEEWTAFVLGAQNGEFDLP